METFIREYMLSDPSICDALPTVFRKHHCPVNEQEIRRYLTSVAER